MAMRQKWASRLVSRLTVRIWGPASHGALKVALEDEELVHHSRSVAIIDLVSALSVLIALLLLLFLLLFLLLLLLLLLFTSVAS